MIYEYPNPALNVFLMIPYRELKPLKNIDLIITKMLSEYGLNRLRADEYYLKNLLWENLQMYMDSSNYGIAVIENFEGDCFNPNVFFELGYMIAKRKHCLILKEKSITDLPADLKGHLYHEFDANAIQDSIKPVIISWLQQIGIAKKPNEKILLFVSQGGTCRDAMAKAITDSLIVSKANKNSDYKVRVESRAMGIPSLATASKSAKKAICKLINEDLLKDYYTQAVTRKIIDDANLILTFDDGYLKNLPKEKTYSFHQFFKISKIVDPWPDNEDETSLDRYLRTAEKIYNAIDDNYDELISTVLKN